MAVKSYGRQWNRLSDFSVNFYLGNCMAHNFCWLGRRVLLKASVIKFLGSVIKVPSFANCRIKILLFHIALTARETSSNGSRAFLSFFSKRCSSSAQLSLQRLFPSVLAHERLTLLMNCFRRWTDMQLATGHAWNHCRWPYYRFVWSLAKMSTSNISQ